MSVVWYALEVCTEAIKCNSTADFRKSYDSDNNNSSSSDDDVFSPRKKTKSINEPLLLPGDAVVIPARDTSFRAWLTVFFAMLSYSAALAIMYSFGVYVVRYRST